ncbi:MAG: DUF6516 family protein [Halochromatium sp.]|uniref:toxin-antitoxin system TumE family protein n=1 Tax=Halochromatium sp. TaxID=2049430 RepID=UPI00397D48F2
MISKVLTALTVPNEQPAATPCARIGAIGERLRARADPAPLLGSAHGYKYRLALIVDEVCVLRYDNEAGKGDHKYLGEREMPYQCDGIDQLIGDCWADVSQQ